MQSIEIKSADPVRDAIKCIVDPKIVSFHLKAHAPSIYTRSAHEVPVREQGHCPGHLAHTDVAAILWPPARWDARRARHAAVRSHKKLTQIHAEVHERAVVHGCPPLLLEILHDQAVPRHTMKSYRCHKANKAGVKRLLYALVRF